MNGDFRSTPVGPVMPRSKAPKTGYNFAAVLVNPQHKIARIDLKGFSIYITRDSCPMCSGMIAQQQISRAILGSSNPVFGKNFDRMNTNSCKCGTAATAGSRSSHKIL